MIGTPSKGTFSTTPQPAGHIHKAPDTTPFVQELLVISPDLKSVMAPEAKTELKIPFLQDQKVFCFRVKSHMSKHTRTCLKLSQIRE